MKLKEIAAAMLLFVMIASSVINVICINDMCLEMQTLIQNTADASEKEKWEEAQANAQKAIKLWEKKDSYTHIVLRHSEIDTLSDALFDLYAAVNEENSRQTAAVAKKVLYHLDSIAKMEMPSFGSIF